MFWPLDRLYQYSRLMRLHRPAGKVLLLWPALIALWLASEGVPATNLVIIFILGTFIMSSAGCVINDFADRHVDGQVERTKDRPFATGKVTSKEALGLFIFLLVIAFMLVCTTNTNTIILSLMGAFLATLYPFTKRFIHFPQVILGAAYGWAIPLAYSANEKSLNWECWLLFIATLLWAIAYDTQYAMVDIKDDQKVGIKSTALLFGRYDKFWIGLCHLLMLGLITLIGYFNQLGIFYYIGILVAATFALYQQWLIRHREPNGCFQAFLNNQWLGAALFVGLFLDTF